MNNIPTIFMIIGLVILGFINVIASGWGLYLWAASGLAFKVALWSAFKVWIIGIVIGAALAATALMLEK